MRPTLTSDGIGRAKGVKRKLPAPTQSLWGQETRQEAERKDSVWGWAQGQGGGCAHILYQTDQRAATAGTTLKLGNKLKLSEKAKNGTPISSASVT